MREESSVIARQLETYFEPSERSEQKRKEQPKISLFLNIRIVILMALALNFTKLALWATRRVNQLEQQKGLKT